LARLANRESIRAKHSPQRDSSMTQSSGAFDCQPTRKSLVDNLLGRKSNPQGLYDPDSAMMSGGFLKN